MGTHVRERSPDPSFKAFRFRLRATTAQEAALLRYAGARRFAYNWALERWSVHYQETGRRIATKLLWRELTALKRDRSHAWLREVDSQLLQQAVIDVQRAFRAFFERRARYPKFASRKRGPERFRIPQRVRVVGDRVYVPKIGWIRLRLSRQVDRPIRSATFKRDAIGRWHVTLVAEVGPLPTPSSELDDASAVGLDLGVADLVVTCDGTRVPAPRHHRRGERKLRRARRALTRKQLDSRNRRRARLVLARAERKLADRRADFLHKLSISLVRRFDVICVEDLGVRGLARTKLGRDIHDAAWRELRRQLTYKAAWHGKRAAVVHRFFPSTRRCSRCGVIGPRLELRIREWRCQSCGVRHDRDVNAAVNIREEGLRNLVAAGRADTKNARGACVRLSEGAAGVEAGIPPTTGRSVNMEVLNAPDRARASPPRAPSTAPRRCA